MTKKWINVPASKSSDPFISGIWEKSSSEPDLSDDRFRIKHPHEYISVDQLKFFRRKKPLGTHIDIQSKSNICLYDKEDVLPFSSLKTEYRTRFTDPTPIGRANLRRRSTSLKLDGLMDIETETHSKYIQFAQEDILRGRQLPIRNPENLILEGDIELNPESRSAFVPFPFFERREKFRPVEKFRIHGDVSITKTENMLEDKPPQEYPADSQKCHLKLEGEMNYIPEYKSQYIPYSVEKSHSIPQLSNIQFKGEFAGIPEYRDRFKFYDSYSKSAPIKKADHLILSGQLEAYPEYKEKFRQSKGIKPANLLKTEDHLRPEGEFSKDVPEYFESFKDPQIKEPPERGKCREPYLRLKGKIEFNPEYRSTYLDYPRSRPIVKKSTSSLRVSNSKSPFRSQKKVYKSNSPAPAYHDPNSNLPFTFSPEYRRAQHVYQIRERTPTREKTPEPPPRQVAQVKGTRKISPRKALLEESGSSEYDVKTNTAITLRDSKKRSPRKRESITILQKSEGNEDVENLGAAIKKTSPRFGRRASISRNAKNIREKSSIIEGNSKYLIKDKKNREEDTSFFILDEPCRKSNWMKKSWYEA